MPYDFVLNTMKTMAFYALLIVALGLAPGASFAADEPPLNIDDVMKKFIQRVQEEDKQKLDDKYSFIEHRLRDELDKNGAVKQHFDRTFQLVTLEGHPFLRTIAKDGKPLSADDRQKQTEREKKFLEEQHKKADDDDLKLDDQFMSHFRFEIVGREQLNDRDSYVISVLPRPSNFPVRNNSEKIFTHMQGRVWVDTRDYSLAKCDLHLSEPTSFYGILGSLRQLDFLLQRRLVDGNVWMTEKEDLSLDGRKLVSSIRMKQESTYSDFARLTQ
jgi:hypothetical protein